MDVLIVGAGAVGQVYGRHLALAGARVAVFVKEKYAAAARSGFTMYPLKRRRRRAPVEFVPDAVLTDPAEAHARRWDQVWLCVSTPALDGAWLAELLGGIDAATVVALQPGLDVGDRLAAIVGAERVVVGLIGVVSYQAPLPGEEVPAPGVAYVLPRLSPSQFSGDRERVVPIVRALRKGRCPARKGRDVRRTGGFGAAVLMTHIVGLEGAGWSLAEFARGPMLGTATRAARQALVLVGAEVGARPPRLRWLLRAPLMRLGLALGRRVMPFDLEAYLRYHFTKVRDQTRLLMESYLGIAARADLPDDSVRALYERVLRA